MIKIIIIVVLLGLLIVSAYINFETINIIYDYNETFHNMTLKINMIERKLNKTEEFWLDCRGKEIEWGSQLIRLGNFTPMIKECSYFCSSYDLDYIIAENTAEDKFHDLESDLEHKIERRSLYTDDYLCLCV